MSALYDLGMDRMVDLRIRLSQDQASWLNDQVAGGKYRSPSEAVAELIKKRSPSTRTNGNQKPSAKVSTRVPSARTKRELLDMAEQGRKSNVTPWTGADARKLVARAKSTGKSRSRS
jgi:Arc/MetJ-type ribon-helix-helix transcriptional regulator